MSTKRVAGAMIAATLWMTLWIFPAGAADAIFRCDSDTAVRGDSTVRVLGICGEPDFKEELGDREEGTVVGSDSGDTTFKKEKKRVEKWHYNRGFGDYIYALTFENGVLEKVENAGRGY